MRNITAEDLLRLGFDKIDIKPEDYDGVEGYFYFIFKPNKDKLYSILITEDEKPDKNSFTVGFTELADVLLIRDLDDLEPLIKILNNTLL